jgi:hypothetical protein
MLSIRGGANETMKLDRRVRAALFLLMTLVLLRSPGAPIILVQPTNQTVLLGGAASFSVAAIAGGNPWSPGTNSVEGTNYDPIVTAYAAKTAMNNIYALWRLNQYVLFLRSNNLVNVLYDSIPFYPQYQNTNSDVIYSLRGVAGTNVGGQWAPWGLQINGAEGRYAIFTNLAGMTYSGTVMWNGMLGYPNNTNGGYAYSINSPTLPENRENFVGLNYDKEVYTGMVAWHLSVNGAIPTPALFFQDAVYNPVETANGLRHTFTTVYDGASVATGYLDGSSENPQAWTTAYPPSGAPDFIILGGSWDAQDGAIGNGWEGTVHSLQILDVQATDEQVALLEEAARILDPRLNNVVVYGDSQEMFRGGALRGSGCTLAPATGWPSWSYFALPHWVLDSYVYDFGFGGSHLISELTSPRFLEFYILPKGTNQYVKRADLYMGGAHNDLYGSLMAGQTVFNAKSNLNYVALTNGFQTHAWDLWKPDSNSYYFYNCGTLELAPAGLTQNIVYNGLMQSNSGLFGQFVADSELIPDLSTNTELNPQYAQYSLDGVHLTAAGNLRRALSIIRGPASYLWRKNGSNTANTDSALTIPVVHETDAGQYDVVVTDQTGSTTSSVVTIAVAGAPPILTVSNAAASMHVSLQFTVATNVAFRLSETHDLTPPVEWNEVSDGVSSGGISNNWRFEGILGGSEYLGATYWKLDPYP